MSCTECKNEKHLYQRTVHGRVSGAKRRTKRAFAGAAVLGLLATGSATTLTPAHAADFSGFSSYAQAIPLRIEVHEPAIPVPSDPQLELNFSYTKVNGASGPIGTARASAMWPGDAVGEGLKTFGEQLGLPGALTDNGYPVQVNAQSPGDVAAATQEFFPGMTGKVTTSDKAAIAKVGYGTSGDVAEGDSGDGSTSSSPPSLLDILKSGDLGALQGLLAGAQTAGPGEGTPSSSPLGALGLIINAGGMDSISRTTYDPDLDAIVATSTARLGSIALLGGIVKLDGVEVVTKVTSNLAKGAIVSRKVTIGAMTIAGNKFALTGDGVEAMGKTNPIPGLPDAPAAALAALGISFDLGKATVTKSGSAGLVTAEGLRITIKTAPLLSKLPKLPLADLVSKLPDLPGQASILKGLIIALGQATPQVDLVLGQSMAQAETVAGIDDGTPSPPTGPTTSPGSTGNTAIPPTSTGPIGPETAPAADVPPIVTPGITNPNKLASGLPDLGGLPTWMALLGLAIAGGAGWYIWRAGGLMFGAATQCAHGLKSGIPDLRKV
jgi:hypothetical protein